MKKADRIILLFLVLGVWMGVGKLWIDPTIVNAGAQYKAENSLEKHKHSTNDISKFKWKVRRIVEDCSVNEGEILC